MLQLGATGIEVLLKKKKEQLSFLATNNRNHKPLQTENIDICSQDYLYRNSVFVSQHVAQGYSCSVQIMLIVHHSLAVSPWDID
jgi:hypothetical protein